MTREEAIKNLMALRGSYREDFNGETIVALDMAISALRQQIPVKPKEYEDKYYSCPVCGNLLMYKWMVYPEKLMPRSDGLPCCLNCLQAIDWSDTE